MKVRTSGQGHPDQYGRQQPLGRQCVHRAVWRSVKYEEIYLHACDTPSEANTALERYFRFYNARRTHQGLGDLTPNEVSFGPK